MWGISLIEPPFIPPQAEGDGSPLRLRGVAEQRGRGTTYKITRSGFKLYGTHKSFRNL